MTLASNSRLQAPSLQILRVCFGRSKALNNKRRPCCLRTHQNRSRARNDSQIALSHSAAGTSLAEHAIIVGESKFCSFCLHMEDFLEAQPDLVSDLVARRPQPVSISFHHQSAQHRDTTDSRRLDRQHGEDPPAKTKNALTHRSARLFQTHARNRAGSMPLAFSSLLRHPPMENLPNQGARPFDSLASRLGPRGQYIPGWQKKLYTCPRVSKDGPKSRHAAVCCISPALPSALALRIGLWPKGVDPQKSLVGRTLERPQALQRCGLGTSRNAPQPKNGPCAFVGRWVTKETTQKDLLGKGWRARGRGGGAGGRGYPIYAKKA